MHKYIHSCIHDTHTVRTCMHTVRTLYAHSTCTTYSTHITQHHIPLHQSIRNRHMRILNKINQSVKISKQTTTQHGIPYRRSIIVHNTTQHNITEHTFALHLTNKFSKNEIITKKKNFVLTGFFKLNINIITGMIIES